MTEIKAKELQELWEWCGFKYERRKRRNSYSHFWIYPDGNEQMTYPPIDLNNLFKYAVPKLLPEYAPIEMVAYPSNLYGYHFSIMKKYSGDHKDPAIALYQAIQKARRTTNG